MRSAPELDGFVPPTRDTTPLPTRIILVATLVLTAAIAFRVTTVDGLEALAPYLVLLTALFVARVVGQIVVALSAPAWLPPMEKWNLMPYPILLPIQLVIVGVMGWIDVAFARGTGAPTAGGAGLGRFLVAFGVVYAAAMVIRYVARMTRRPGERWFGGTIPIVFHLVLATYLLALGTAFVDG